MLPGKAIRLPRPSRLRSREATKATPTPHQGPSSTAHSTLTMCCTGAHLLPNIGKLNTLPTTHRAQNIPASASFFAETFFMRENSFPVGRLQTAAPANHALPAKKAKRSFGLRSRLAGLLSRRNTASHRCRLQGSGRSPSARCACAQSRPLQGGNDSSSKNADKTKTGDTRRGASCKKSSINDFLRRHYPHQVKGSKVDSFLSACITSSPVFGS